ncbi:hypothetical protein ACRXCV_11990 [Halobacteriovorax sp. GFR7]|uniref:hypothetical protein n=1 Tax=unclassified Halobacteriovorax TaxID=2639665 RepID=UPI003D992526
MKLDNRGLSLAEIVVTAGLLGVLIYAFVGGQNVFRKANKKSRSQVVQYNIVHSLYRKISSNSALFQMNLNSDDFLSMTSVQDLNEKLPLAWNDKLVTSVDECPSCPGRLGYVLIPHPSYRGLLKLVIRVTHRSYIEGFKDYEFIISGE